MIRRSRTCGFSLLALALAVPSCGAPGASTIDAGGRTDASLDGSVRPDAPDAATPVDGGAPDAGVDASVAPDGGTTADSGLDAAAIDAATGPDSGDTLDGGPVDASALLDGGPPTAPIGAAVDVTGTLCALDAAGNFWCWGRWTPVEEVRLLGTDFTRSAGSCAQRADNSVWCADFAALAMVPLEVDAGTPVIGGVTRLVLDEIVEYSDVDVGCGRIRPGDPRSMWGNSVCWTSRRGGWTYTDGYGNPLLAGGGGDALVAVSATPPREMSQLCCSPTYEAYDVNPPSTCRSDGTRASCIRDTGGSYDAARPVGDHYVLGFGMSCGHNAGMTTCSTGIASLPTTYTDDGAFHDQAVSWPIGTWSTVGGVPRYYEARGLCISGATLRCYDDAGTLAYTVAW